MIWPLFDANGQFLGDKLLGVYTVDNDSLLKHEAQQLKDPVTPPIRVKAKL